MQILMMLQQAQVQRAAEQALHSMDERAMQAQAVSEQQQQQDLQVDSVIFAVALASCRVHRHQKLTTAADCLSFN